MGFKDEWRGVLVALVFSVLPQYVNSREETIYENYMTDAEYKYFLKDYIFFEISYPQELAFTYKVNPSSFTPAWNVSYTGASLVPTDPSCGCGYIRNHEEVEGRIAFIERGDCSFVSKVIRAEEAGAIGVIITDSDIDNDDIYISMVDDTTQRKVQIPAVFLLGKNGQIIKRTLEKLHLNHAEINIPVNITKLDIHKLNQPPWLV
eukprot:TRINITY_DN10505_c0_g1_i7.p1 TRINITY_DN10505_c0_g1~~TRINITY_DN10505_c0_g1_i7.p1  ORF type:complete len:205 (-),score=11.12 TRINITY_DN10505_c0_g1_i7:215-829(-)